MPKICLTILGFPKENDITQVNNGTRIKFNFLFTLKLLVIRKNPKINRKNILIKSVSSLLPMQ